MGEKKRSGVSAATTKQTRRVRRRRLRATSAAANTVRVRPQQRRCNCDELLTPRCRCAVAVVVRLRGCWNRSLLLLLLRTAVLSTVR